MILISKVLFGSVAAATLAGSVVFPDGVETARNIAASMRWGGTADLQPAPAAPAMADGGVQLPTGPQHCPGRCEFWALLSQMR